VLKLHGSMGWFRRGGQEIYLRHVNYLQCMEIPNFDGLIYDRNEPSPGSGPEENPLLIFPSYLKQLEGPVHRSIWDQAAGALSHAEEIIFVGYSLGPADVAVQTLVNPIRRRLAQRALRVKVIDPVRSVLNRWRDFLGDSAQLIEQTAKEYFSSPS